MGNTIKRLILAGLFVLISGCSTLSPTFVQAVQEHRQDTMSVNQSLILTFQEEMEAETRPEAKAAYQEIINNLSTVSHQADLLHRYLQRNMTEDELIMVLRSKWRIKP
ncbi:MAG: hypothetical protein ACXAC5_01240 [Promethearchaeota archaeon]